MARPRLRTPELREHVLDHATAIVEREGLGGLRTRSVAEVAGTSLAAINELFGSKAGLVNSIALSGFERLRDHLDAAPVDPIPDRSLRNVCAAHREFTTSRPHLTSIMYSRPHESFDPTERDRNVAHDVRRHFTRRIHGLLDEHATKNSAFDAAVGLISLLQGLHHQEQAGTLGADHVSANRRWNNAITIYLNGLHATIQEGFRGSLD